MSQRQRRRKDQRRKQAQRRGPTKRQVATGATIAMGATVAATGTAQAADFTVANLNDAGAGSLRQAVIDANNNAGADRILFQSGLSGSINLTTGQLNISDPVEIQGPGSGTLTVHNTGVGRVAYVHPGSGQSVTVSGLTLVGASGNDVTNGGIFYAGGVGSNSNLTIADSVLTGSVAISNGGAIQVYNGSVHVQNSTISGNNAGSNGAGIYVYFGSLQVDSSTISGNTAGSGGGGVYFGDTNAPSAIRNSTISGNRVTGGFGDGGAVYLDNDYQLSPILIENSTLSGNIAGSGGGDKGGAIYDFSNDGNPSALTIDSSTIAANSAGEAGGGIYQYYGETIRSTIIADNTAPDGSDLAGPTDLTPTSGIPAAVAFSLIEHVNSDTPINQTGPNLIGVDPQLGGLASNGGPTQTQLPAASSPVIDKGNALLTSDQRGVLRPIDFPAIPNAADGSDIGAVELQPSNAFQLGKLKRNKKKGTAKQVVILPLPDAGSVTIKGRGLKTKTRQVTGVAKVKLPVIAKGKKRRQEVRTGKVKIKAKVTYNAVGNAANTLKRKLKLLKR
jgi:hypothetical protein